MNPLTPVSPEDLAAALSQAASSGRRIELGGRFSKRRLGGPLRPPDIVISTAALNQILQYEPRDLTISVGAGLKWADLERALAENRQMIPLDPPWRDDSTVGGVLASNLSGPKRYRFGTARDFVIGMKFATLEGKLVQSGGMVVKNVAGLDMSKLLIGSFGTLAAIASANFKLSPMPESTRTWLYASEHLDAAIAKRDEIVQGVLQPLALDLINPHAAGRIGLEGWVLAVQAGGTEKVLARYARELAGAEVLEGEAEAGFWTAVREFVPQFLRDHEEGGVVRVSSTMDGLGPVLREAPVPVLARAGNGVCQACFADCEAGRRWLQRMVEHGWPAVGEAVPSRSCSGAEQWPRPSDDLPVMQKVKELFDPRGLLNSGRLYGRI